MLVTFIRLLKGYVRFRISGKSPERFMNLCAQRGIILWNAQPTAQGLEACVSAKDYRQIRPSARKAKIKTKMLKKRGIPFVTAKYKGRIGIPIGMALGIALLILLSQFIWTIDVVGLKTVSEQRLLDLLVESGVKAGAYKYHVDTGQARRDILLEVDEIGWLSVNITGSHAKVEVKEKTQKPPLEDNPSPCNIKAAKDGVITKITAGEGMAQVQKGSGVAKGDLLISGVNLTAQNTVRYVRAKGEVWADIISEKVLSIDKQLHYNSILENKSERRRIHFLGAQFPCSLSFRTFENTAYTQADDSFTLNGVALPLGIVTETAWELSDESVTLSREQAQSIFDTSSLLYEIFEHGGGKRTGKQFKIEETDSSYIYRINYVFNENIAESVDFNVEE